MYTLIKTMETEGYQGSVALYRCETTKSVFVLKTHKNGIQGKIEIAVMHTARDLCWVVKPFELPPVYQSPLRVATYYCANGDLFEMLDYLHTTHKITDLLARTMCIQLVYGIQELHDAGIVHRDIKPENIFIDERFRLLYGDFGYSECNAETNVALTNVCGSDAYLAPEMKNKSMTGGVYNGYAADVWSLACFHNHRKHAFWASQCIRL
jgi:serine/threonine protein kinase